MSTDGTPPTHSSRWPQGEKELPRRGGGGGATPLQSDQEFTRQKQAYSGTTLGVSDDTDGIAYATKYELQIYTKLCRMLLIDRKDLRKPYMERETEKNGPPQGTVGVNQPVPRRTETDQIDRETDKRGCPNTLKRRFKPQ